MSIFTEAVIASTLAGMATVAGALPVFFIDRISDSTRGLLTGFGAGVMLAASCFSLIIPAFEITGENLSSAVKISAAVFSGAMVLLLADRFFPHEHFEKGREGSALNIRQTWLFIFAITIHNFPEGLAVGASYAGIAVTDNPEALAWGIGLQDLPEGLVVAVSLAIARYPVSKILLITFISGLAEPLGGIVGAGVISLSAVLLPWGLGFAAGAMIWVISHEIIPESHRYSPLAASWGILSGFLIMMILDVGL